MSLTDLLKPPLSTPSTDHPGARRPSARRSSLQPRWSWVAASPLLVLVACTASTDRTTPTRGAGADSGGGAENDSDAPVVGDSAEDTGDSAPSDSAADTGPAEATPPVVTLLGFSHSEETLVVSFRVEDPDGDAEAGSLRLTVDGEVRTLSYDQLDAWDGTAGEVSWPIPPWEHGSDVLVELVALDGAGHRGDDTAGVTLPGASVTLIESGDTPSDETPLGVVASPTYICGEIDRAVGHEYYQGSDLDWLTFSVDVSARWTLSLTWTERLADEDLLLMDSAGVELVYADDHTAAQPEEAGYPLIAGESYYAWVGGWSLPSSSYVLVIR